jgi:glycine/D-amino acid oxidase-like deaminating enzyme
MVDVGFEGSLWRATAKEAVEIVELNDAISADVAVVGAGYTGLSTALHLAESGSSVAVLEAQEPGWGASGRNGGMVIAGLKEDPEQLVENHGAERAQNMIRASGAAADLVFQLIDRYGIDCEPVRKGWIQPAHVEKFIPELRERCRQWQDQGVDASWLDRDELSRLVGRDMYHGGWLDPRCGGLNPLSYARGLARAAQSAGAQIYSHSPATALTRESRGWRLRTPKGDVRADQVVLAGNGYTGDLWPGLAETVIPVFSVQVATRPLGDNVRRTLLPDGHILSDTRRILWYFRQDHEGRLLMGGGGTAYESGIGNIHHMLRRRVSGLFDDDMQPSFQYAWHGKVAVTRDHLPHLHEPAPGLWTAMGYNGRGVAMATMMGKILAARAAGQSDPEYDFPTSPLSPVPLHQFRDLAITAMRYYYRLRDSLES